MLLVRQLRQLGPLVVAQEARQVVVVPRIVQLMAPGVVEPRVVQLITPGVVEPRVVQLVAPGVMVPRWDPRCAVIRRMNRLRDHRFLSRLNRSHRRFSLTSLFLLSCNHL